MRNLIWLLAGLCLFQACNKSDTPATLPEDINTLSETGSIDIGDIGAAEISAYDPVSRRLFTVNNSGSNKIDVISLANPSKPVLESSISMTTYNGAANSVDVFEGKLAIALEDAVNKQAPGKVVVLNTTDLKEIKVVAVGALPDMITFSPDGSLLLTANEGEPSQDYLNDPEGTVSVIEVNNDYRVTNLGFGSFSSRLNELRAGGFRVFGPNATLARDVEPEYITVSPDSKKAWVTLQENNGIGVINLVTKTVENILPLGFKNYASESVRIDPSDRDGGIFFATNWNARGIYQPDGIAMLQADVPLLFTANEGDAREYTAFAEMRRVRDVMTEPTIIAPALRADAQLGRLNITTTLGDRDNDGDFEELFSIGSRSFSIWNGNTGALVYDSRNELELRTVAAGLYDDGRSDDKGVEPEAVCIGEVSGRRILFVGLERADAVALYDITNPYYPVFMRILPCGDAPEGVLFIPAAKSPNGRSLLVVSSENDGVVKIYSTR